jgi:hypothetical protein
MLLPYSKFQAVPKPNPKAIKTYNFPSKISKKRCFSIVFKPKTGFYQPKTTLKASI